MKGLQINNALPLYVQLKDLIVRQIKEGELNPGEKLPSERELCEKYNVSRITVRQALGELENAGLIYRSHGKGAFVAHKKVEQELFAITPFEHSLLSKGLKPQTKFLEAKVIPNNYRLSKIMGLPLYDNLVELTLLGLGDDLHMAFYTSYFEYNLGLRMENLARNLNKEGQSFTTLDLYRYIPEIVPGVAYQTFEASVADSFISDMLQVKKGSPVLIVESNIYNNEDKLLEYKTAVYRGDKYKFSIVRQVSPTGSSTPPKLIL